MGRYSTYGSSEIILHIPRSWPWTKAEISSYRELTRPFTLIYPAVAVLSSALCAVGYELVVWDFGLITRILLCAVAASFLNAASNVLNQIADLEIDRINKPERPLSRGAISIASAWRYTVILYVFAMASFALIDLAGGSYCFVIGLLTALITYFYSFGLRTKAHWIAANFTIALGRGLLVVLMGWSCVSQVAVWDPVIIGSIFGIFLFGAASSKDFSDIKGDEAHGCITLPVQIGVVKACWVMVPFLCLPFLLTSAGSYFNWLMGDPTVLMILGLVMSIWGMLTVYLIVRKPKAMCSVENHPSWIHMYLMLMMAQVGYAVAYLA